MGSLPALDERWSQVSRRRGQVSTGKQVQGAVMFLLRCLGEGVAVEICMAPIRPRLKEKMDKSD